MKYCTMIIQNFKSFYGKHEFLLDRKPGLYHLAGHNKLTGDSNGAGKSSILDALTWVRFGKTGRDNRPGASIRPWKINPSDTTSVELIFEGVDGKTRQLYRSRRPNKLKMGWIDEEFYDVTQEEVDKAFGFSEEMFRRAVVMAQQEVSFLDMRPEQQSQMFTDALNLDVWLQASQLAGKKHREKVEHSEEIRLNRSRILGQIKELKLTLESERKLSSNFNHSKQAKRAEIETRLRATLTKVNGLTALPPAKGGLAIPSKAPKPTFKGGTAGTAGKVARGVPAPLPNGHVGPALVALAKALTTVTQVYNTAQAQLYTQTSKHNQLQTQIKTLDKEKVKYQIALSKSPYCPECGQKTSKHHLKRKLSELNLKFAKILEADTEVTKTIYKIEKQVDDLADIQKLEHEISKLLDQLKEIEQQSNPHKKAILTHKERLGSLRENKHKLSNSLETSEKQAEEYDYWIEAFKAIRLELIDTTLTELEMACIQHIGALGLEDGWELKFQTERETKSGSIPKFSALLYPPDSKEPAKWENYSGGENQRWRFAVALGLSDIILSRIGVQPNIEVYDEPTRGMSPEGTELFLEHLRERALELGKCIYVVEHHSLERGLFDGVITIVKTNKGSRILKEKESRI